MDRSIPSEPIEPFDEETESFKEETTPKFETLKPPGKPLTKEKLKLFVSELEPIVKGINFLKHEEKEKLGKWLLEMVEAMHSSKLSQKIRKKFEEFSNQYQAYLAYPSPFDHNRLLDKLADLKTALS